MAGAYENSIHQWKAIVVFVVDCVSVLTLDELAGKLYTISANEAGSRAHKAAGASAPVVWSPKPLLRVRILLPLPYNHPSFDTKLGWLFLHVWTDGASEYGAVTTIISLRTGKSEGKASFSRIGFVPFRLFDVRKRRFFRRMGEDAAKMHPLWTIWGKRPKCRGNRPEYR